MKPNPVTFRVHYALTTIDGVQQLHRDIDAETPDAAAAILSKSLKPRLPAISKVKRLKGPPLMTPAEQIAHCILYMGFGFSMYLALATRVEGL